MGRIIKSVAALLLLCIGFTALCSCKRDRDYDENEVLSAAAELIEKTHKINELFYGKGLEYTDEGIGVYKKASAESLEYFGISTVEDMKNMVRGVFSQSYSEVIFSSDIFTSVKIGDEIKSYARYYQSYDENEIPNGIMVRSDYEYPVKGSYTYGESLEVYDVEGEIIVVSALVSATSEDGKQKDISFKIRLIEENSAWRLISPTYVVYNEYTDYYDDLINNK